MAGITLAQAEAQLALWLAADAAVATGQSYSIGSGAMSRSLTRADASEITAKIDYWQGQVNRLTQAASGRGRSRYAVFE